MRKITASEMKAAVKEALHNYADEDFEYEVIDDNCFSIINDTFTIGHINRITKALGRKWLYFIRTVYDRPGKVQFHIFRK